MTTEFAIVAALIGIMSAIVGGVVVAVVNYYFIKRLTQPRGTAMAPDGRLDDFDDYEERIPYQNVADDLQESNADDWVP